MVGWASSFLLPLPSWATHIEHYWHAELRRHFAVEERIWLPALAQAGLRELTERTTIEHDMIAAPATDRGLPVRWRVACFAQLLHGHVLLEERELFEAAQRTLTENELATLARAMES